MPNYLSTDALGQIRSFIAAAVERSGDEYVDFRGFDNLAGSGLEELGRSPRFVTLMHALFEQGTGLVPVRQNFYPVLRCLIGTLGQRHSMVFHYDSYVITALIPIVVPAQGRRGDLLIFPNTRKLRSTYLINVVDKMLLGNALAQMVLRACVNTRRLAPVRVTMCPGHLYLFWGYRSIHTNEPCDPDKLRATALFHYGNPHCSTVELGRS